MLGFVSQIRETEFCFSHGQGDAVKAVRIGSSALFVTTLKDVSANQRLGGRPVCHISADCELAAYRLLFFLLQKNVPSGNLITYRFILKSLVENFPYRLLFYFECDAAVDFHLFTVDE